MFCAVCVEANNEILIPETLECPLTCDECKKIVETFQNDKALGEEGFTVEFATYFFELLGNNSKFQ